MHNDGKGAELGRGGIKTEDIHLPEKGLCKFGF